MSEAKRIFIGGVGYTNLRDLSVGPIVLPQRCGGALAPTRTDLPLPLGPESTRPR